MKTLTYLTCFTFLVNGQCSDSDLSKKIEELTKRLEQVEGKNVSTMKNQTKKRVLFRGQPEIADVFVSSTLNADNYKRHSINKMFDKNLATFWHNSNGSGGDFIKVRFHKTETIKKIEIFRHFDQWQLANPVRYRLQLFLYKDDKVVNLKKTTDGAGNPFVPGAWRDFWNPISVTELLVSKRSSSYHSDEKSIQLRKH